MRLLDTNIVSFMVKNDSRYLLYEQHTVGWDLAISFMTRGELFEWPLHAKWSEKRTRSMERFIDANFIVLHSDEDMCRHFAYVRHQRRAQPIPNDDAWIAATALRFGLELVTHNPKDFQGIRGLRVISECPLER